MNHISKYIKISSLFIIFLFIFTGCKEDLKMDVVDKKAPVITDFSPKTGEIGSEITITGENLQWIDTVRIGGGDAEIKYKVNGEKLVAVVTSKARTGKLLILNINGQAESTEDFTVTYAVPVIENYPTEGTVNEDILLEGQNLHAIDAVLLGDAEAKIVSKRENEIVFQIPYSEASEPVALRFAYFDGTAMAYVGPEGNTFTILREAPVVLEVPASLEKYTPATITGERLNLINALYINDIQLMILSQSEDAVTFDLPTTYFGGNMTGTLKAVYYEVKELIIAENFQIIADINEPRYYIYNNVLLSARVNEGGTENAFFVGKTGEALHSCSVYDNRTNIDFFLYDQAGFVQLYGPHNATNTLKNFKCDNVSLTAIHADWSEFYATNTRFKILSRDSVSHVALIDAYTNGQIVELNDELFEGILKPGTSAPRIYKNYADIPEANKAASLSIDKNNLAWVRNYTTGKNGIIKVTGIPKEASAGGRYPELTMDAIWEK